MSHSSPRNSPICDNRRPIPLRIYILQETCAAFIELLSSSLKRHRQRQRSALFQSSVEPICFPRNRSAPAKLANDCAKTSQCPFKAQKEETSLQSPQQSLNNCDRKMKQEF